MREQHEHRIDDALQGEAMRSVPPHLFARIKAKLFVLGAIQNERRQFGFSFIPTGLVLTFMWGLGVYLLVFPEHVEGFWRNYPGIMGYGDYLSVGLPISITRLIGSGLMLAGLPLSVMLIRAVIRWHVSGRLFTQSH